MRQYVCIFLVDNSTIRKEFTGESIRDVELSARTDVPENWYLLEGPKPKTFTPEELRNFKRYGQLRFEE